MDRHISVPVWLVITLSLWTFSGCGWWGGEADRDVEEDVSDSIDEPAPASTASKPPAVPPSTPDPGLKAGDRFPLLKTVKQTLQQPSPQGWAVSRSTLETLMTVSIEEIHRTETQPQDLDQRSGQKRLLVKFERIRFSQEVPGQPRVEYDSSTPPDPIPAAALGYHGLKDNSLGFWLSAENQVVELVGYEQFVNRCLQDVPPEKRRQLSAAIAVPTAAEGIASFVDENIGLLPATALRDGDSWLRDRQILQPVPLHVSQKHTLRQMTADVADIEIQGTISPPVPYGLMNQPARDVRVTIRGGQSLGRCRIDRRTGLPVDARVEQSLEMTVRLAGGAEFDQYKSTITSIQSYSEPGNSVVTAAGERAATGLAPRVAQGTTDGRAVPGRNSGAGTPPNPSAARASTTRGTLGVALLSTEVRF